VHTPLRRIYIPILICLATDAYAKGPGQNECSTTDYMIAYFEAYSPFIIPACAMPVVLLAMQALQSWHKENVTEINTFALSNVFFSMLATGALMPIVIGAAEDEIQTGLWQSLGAAVIVLLIWLSGEYFRTVPSRNAASGRVIRRKMPAHVQSRGRAVCTEVFDAT
jgi:hypothetical protein